MPSTPKRVIPWPGPRPYRTTDRNYFYGRRREIDEIRRRVLAQPLTILSGPSGTGKTSLIQAGVVWDLTESRKVALETGRATAGPVLLLTEWGGVQGAAVERVLRDRLKSAVTDLQERAPDDFRVLSDVYKPDAEAGRETLLEDVQALCDCEGGVILIFDQFEEVLRAGEEQADEAVDLIGDLYRFEPRAHLLLSLRQEYNRELHKLEVFTEALSSRTYYLRAMTYGSAREAILQSAQAAGVQIGAAEVETILQWLAPEGETAAQPASDTIYGRNRAISGREQRPIDLLTLQTILYELLEEIPQDKPPVIDSEVLKVYRDKHQPEKLVGQALERWIERALREPQVPSGPDIPMIYQVDPAVLTGFVRRIASAIAPYLSSGGYKTPAEELSLMYAALSDDFARLVPDFENKERRRFSVATDGNHYRLDKAALGVSSVQNEDGRRNISGLARQNNWDPGTTAEQLIAVYEEAKRRLKNGNILKSVLVKRKLLWELVHDRLGEPFSHWADQQRNTWADSIYTLTVRRGKDIYISQSDGDRPVVQSAMWQGCWVFPRDGTPLDGFVFQDCNLQGTAFFRCKLTRAHFVNCIIDGALFINCDFDDVLFDGATGNGIAFLTNSDTAVSRVKDLYFESCDISQMKMSRLTLEGALAFGSETKLYLCDFADLRGDPSEGAPGRLRLENGARLEFCAWDLHTQALIDIERGCNLIASGRRYEESGTAKRGGDTVDMAEHVSEQQMQIPTHAKVIA